MTAEANTKVLTAVIPNAASLSGEVDLEGFKLVAVLMPVGWDAAALTFQAADVAGGTFLDVHDDEGAEVAATVAAARAVGLDAILPELAALRFIKIRSGTSATPVNQTAERTLTLVLKA